MICAACGNANPERAKFCLECGARVGGAAAASSTLGDAGARKVVSIVFADLVGSTALHERLDAESARPFMERYYAVMRAAVEAHGGTVAKLLGDGVMAVFGVPRVAEDDAIRAVRAAVAMQAAFRDLVDRERAVIGTTGLRVAVNSGEVVARAATELIGDPVNVAARLQEQGGDGDVVIGEATRRLVASLVTLAPLGSVTLKGRAEAVAAYRVVSLEPPAGTATTPFVGRTEELARLIAVYEAAVATPSTRLAVVLGSAGLGKSRVIAELSRRLGGGATVLTGHCDATGGATFAPLADALRAWLQVDDGAGAEALRAALDAALPRHEGDRPRILTGVTALLAGAPGSPEETFFVVRRLLAAVASTRPVVLVIDDLHWAEPLLLDLLEHLAQWGSGVPLFVLVGARPELRDARSSLAAPGTLVAEVVTLAGLDAGAATRLAANVIGADDLPAAVAIKVLATSEGNPLFVGELVRMLVHEGALQREGDRWIVGAGLATLEMPPTIHAVLAARIERLRADDRAVLERAAVVGRTFSRSALAELLRPAEGDSPAPDLDTRFESLRRSELIERDAGWLLGEPAWRFHHVLIRDAAYRRLLKGTRAELHARLADWITGRVGEAVEHDETIGWHLEQAHQHRRELGPLDAAGRALGERASRHLAAAGRRALARDDPSLAAGLFGRALAGLEPADPRRAELALDWCEALLAAGDVGTATTAIDELGRFIADSERLRAWHACFTGQRIALTAPEALTATVDTVAAAAEALSALGDAVGEAKAHAVHAQALGRLGRVGPAEAALDRALAAARRAGDRRRANAVLAGAPLAALWGPSPVTRASGRCLDVVRVLRITQGAPHVEAVALSCQGVLEALRGRTEAARRMVGSARELVEELGIAHRLFEADVFAARIDLLEGDAAAAERVLRVAYDGLRDLGLGIDAARAGSLLARALLAQGRAAEAETLSYESERLAGDDLQATIAWRGVRAEALARRGEYAAAIELAQAAVGIAAATDALLDHADARLALAAALRAAGRDGDAAAEERRAWKLWDAKGATVRSAGAQRATPVDPDRDAEVIAGFEASRLARAAIGSGRRRVRSNAATAAAERFDAAAATRDDPALVNEFTDDFQAVDHPNGISYGRDASLDSFRRLRRVQDPTMRHELLATFAEDLALYRRHIEASGTTGGRLDVGAFEREEFVVYEVDGRGRFRAVESFAAGRLGEATACLFRRHADLLPDGAARRRAAGAARSIAALSMMRETGMAERAASALSPAIAMVDHRLLGFPPAHGTRAAVDQLRTLFEVARGVTIEARDLLHLAADAILARFAISGLGPLDGGAFELRMLLLLAFDADGLIVHYETFDDDREGEAMARIDALTGVPGVAPSAPEANAAARAFQAFQRAWRARHWEGVRAGYHPAHRMDDRRRLMRLEVAGDAFFANERLLFDDTASEWHGELLATRGERRALFRVRFTATVGASGPMEVEMLDLVEVDAAGRRTALVVFDPEDEAAAYAALDAPATPAAARANAAAQAMARYEGLWAARDWEGSIAAYLPSYQMDDRRPLMRIQLTGETFVSQLRLLFDMPRMRFHFTPLATRGERLVLGHVMWQGDVDESGGPFDAEYLEVFEIDGAGRHAASVLFDPADRATADAELDARWAADAVTSHAPATRAPDHLRIPPNVATRAYDRWCDQCKAGAWDALPAAYASDFVFDDRRRLMHLTADRDMTIANARHLWSTGWHPERTVLATAGERLSLNRVLWVRDERTSEVEIVEIDVVDGDGRFLAAIVFDPDDRISAAAELFVRFAGRPMPPSLLEFSHALIERDLTRARASLPDDFVFDDRRRTGLGRLEGADAYVTALAAMFELSPDAIVGAPLSYVAVQPHGMIAVGRTFGTLASGGAFESVFVQIAWCPDDRFSGIELFEVDDLAAARARFEALDALPWPRSPAK